MTTIQLNKEDAKRVFLLARGHYQRGLLKGDYLWSGADLKGKAKSWSSKYSLSRDNLIERIRNAGFKAEFKYGKNNKKRLIITKEKEEENEVLNRNDGQHWLFVERVWHR